MQTQSFCNAAGDVNASADADAGRPMPNFPNDPNLVCSTVKTNFNIENKFLCLYFK